MTTGKGEVDLVHIQEPLNAEEFMDELVENLQLHMRKLDPSKNMTLERLDRQTLGLTFESGQHYQLVASRPFSKNKEFNTRRAQAVEDSKKESQPAMAASAPVRRGPPKKPDYEPYIIEYEPKPPRKRG